MKSPIQRLIAYLLGLTILSFGITLVIRAGVGTGAWDALNVGLSEQIGFTVGMWLIIVGLILIGINALLLKERPDFPAIITIFLLGPMIDLWLLLIPQPEQRIYQVFMFLIGTPVMALGISIYIQANFAFTSVDRFMFAISKRTGFSLQISKTIGELFALLLALLFHGPINIGTILITFLIGPLIQLFLPRVEPFFQTSFRGNRSKKRSKILFK